MIETLSRLVPHTRDVYLRLFEHYSDAIWPVQIVANTLCLLVLWAAMRPYPGSGRIIATILAAAWVWTGIAFLILAYAPLNWLAWLMGFLFVLQGLAFLVFGTIRGRLEFHFSGNGLVHYCGIALAAGSLIVYPLVESPLGFRLPGVGLVGVTPGPTILFTVGLLLLAEPRPILSLFLVPIVCSAITGITGWALMVPQDIWLPAAVLIAFLLALGRRFGRRSTATDLP